MSDPTPLLRVRDLRIAYGSAADAVRGVSFDVHPGEIVAVVGESGSGKTTTAQAVIGLLAGEGRITGGSIEFEGRDLASLSDREFRSLRGARIGLVPQDPTVSLDPVMRIGPQIEESLRIHGRADRRAAAQQAVEVLRRAGLTEPEQRARQFPHELSGGMRQRVLIGMALACSPSLVIADEPTSALDVTVQKRILDHLGDLVRESGSSVLFITHDLAVAAERADRVIVMRHGEIVETGDAATVFRAPEHEYTRHLVDVAPTLQSGTARMREGLARMADVGEPATAVVVAEALTKVFAVRGRRGPVIPSVADVGFVIPAGRTVSLVGESGSGKTTTARMVLRLETPTSGTISVGGTDITRLRGERLREVRREMQVVHQNPYTSLDPRMTIEDIVREPLDSFGVGSRQERRTRVAELLDAVALPEAFASRKAAELSGGQRQRVAIARALALKPRLVVLDEPVSALDVSVQAQILELLAELQRSSGVAYLFISHDLAVVAEISDFVGVMSGGRLVEFGRAADVFLEPQHPYTRQLLAAIPGQHVTDPRLPSSVG